jgi:Na+-translocating ferredoxin:NAD+ oxidoreductase RNF subunit RnfB
MSSIIVPILIVVAIGVIAGLGLSVASILMAVPVDEKVEALTNALPGANCGACGFSGCAGYAKALSEGGAANGLCSPGGAETAAAIASILGLEDSGVELKTALVRCLGTYDNTSNKMNYQGVDKCTAANQLYGGVGKCAFGCMGIGDCIAVCEYGAISICNGVAHIDPTMCKGCSKCVRACPKGLIKFIPYKKNAVVRCMNCDKGALTRKVCTKGCIGCTKCAKVCPEGAIKIEKSLAHVDAEKCTGCGQCVDTCPNKCITIFDI